jgi:single-strand DNA-binding protein
MSTNINTWTIDGNLTADPTSFVPQNSQRFKVELRVAVNDRKKQGEQWVDDPSYFSVEIWGYNDRPGMAGWLLNNVRKGDYVVCTGKAKWREFTDQQNNKREKIIMAAEKIHAPVAAARNKGNGNGNGAAPAPVTTPGAFTPGAFTPGAAPQAQQPGAPQVPQAQQPGAPVPHAQQPQQPAAAQQTPPVIPAMDPNLATPSAAIPQQAPPATIPATDQAPQATEIPVANQPALAGAGVGFQPGAVPEVNGNGIANESDIPF